MRNAPVLHAVFGEAAFGCIRGALGDTPRVGIIVLRDDLSIGPIDRTDGEARTRWLEEQFGSDASEQIACIDDFWSEVASREQHIVAYVSRRNAREYAGLLELLRQRGDAPLELVDVTELEFACPDGSPDLKRLLGIAQLSPAQVIERRLLESAAPLSASARHSYAENWARLRQENASLRVIDNGILVSAPITYFDARIMSLATSEWQPAMGMLREFCNAVRAEGYNAPDVRFVLSRLGALVTSGQLEARGELATVEGSTNSSLRRPH